MSSRPTSSTSGDAVALLSVALLAILCPSGVGASGVLVERRAGLRAGLNPKALQDDLQNAMGVMLGCGSEVNPEQLAEIEKDLLPMWNTLPKNSHGRIERRSLRYLAHRYFMKESSLLIRGFEPTRLVNSSNWGAADILHQRVPAFVESVLGSKNAVDHGFALADAVTMIAALEQLIFDSESTLLEKAYKAADNTGSKERVNRHKLRAILQNYMVQWMVSDDQESANWLMKNPSKLQDAIPHWNQIIDYVEGELKSMQFRRAKEPKSGYGKGLLYQDFSFEDAHEVVGGVTKHFASFWESECRAMKAQLIDMDPKKTGRVPLSKFYGNGLDGEWRFAESEEYLRDLGALDESSRWLGKQVIIPNYLQAASNCIVSSEHYLVCCAAECEDLLGEIEAKVGAPVATPAQLLGIVGNMTSHSGSLDDDEPPQLKGSLTTQLEQIADSHDGTVPLHGRLFAQWLHYAFPRECPFPHKMGDTTSKSPLEYGDFQASKDEMKQHANTAKSEVPHAEETEEELHWMSQWSIEEELVADYSSHVRSGSFRALRMLAGVMLLALVALGATKNQSFAGLMSGKSCSGFDLPISSKAHFV
eukprot:gnl/TRDRNA2_/TRDRNA2_177749_c2_seq14.p1 gnl/TRDRNA2_/TRDRNA2_177749_c2~~gnl/TRDRNA2_/TRDRNA2_177749_c2_seq14.p1  ORF type:complete len:589 (+),score=126.89 gnl/TRDRNA2_/TRDRNA2_177749_c2_seq14:60-1826(+)